MRLFLLVAIAVAILGAHVVPGVRAQRVLSDAAVITCSQVRDRAGSDLRMVLAVL